MLLTIPSPVFSLIPQQLFSSTIDDIVSNNPIIQNLTNEELEKFNDIWSKDDQIYVSNVIATDFVESVNHALLKFFKSFPGYNNELLLVHEKIYFNKDDSALYPYMFAKYDRELNSFLDDVILRDEKHFDSWSKYLLEQCPASSMESGFFFTVTSDLSHGSWLNSNFWTGAQISLALTFILNEVIKFKYEFTNRSKLVDYLSALSAQAKSFFSAEEIKEIKFSFSQEKCNSSVNSTVVNWFGDRTWFEFREGEFVRNVKNPTINKPIENLNEVISEIHAEMSKDFGAEISILGRSGGYWGFTWDNSYLEPILCKELLSKFETAIKDHQSEWEFETTTDAFNEWIGDSFYSNYNSTCLIIDDLVEGLESGLIPPKNFNYYIGTQELLFKINLFDKLLDKYSNKYFK
mgnify:CR=1 FL=1